MSITYSEISSLLSEAKKKKPLTTGDCDAPKVDDSIAKITEGELIEFVGGKPGDGYIGHPNLDIKNPLAKKQVKGPTGNQGVAGKLGDRKMEIDRMTKQMLNQSFDPEGEIVERQYQVGDTIDNSDAVKAYQQKRMDTLQRMIKGDPKKWDFSQQNVNKRMVTGESVELDEGSAAWQKSAGKNKSGGLNEKGRKSYERENPGSDLKAPSKKKGNKRRASFCARMKGMRKRQKPSNNTGEDRLSKSLRAWNC